MTSAVLVTVDSLRADHVGCYGYHRDTTPRIDALAESGVYFDGYANANWTRASFPSIITSTYPLEYGGFEYLSDNRTTVSEAVRDAGVDTAAFHSNLWLSRDYNYDRGFDRFYDSRSEPSLLGWLRAKVKLQLDHDSLLYRILQRLYDSVEKSAGVDIGQTYKDAETITDRSIEWLESRSRDFFIWVHYMDVHHPYLPHEQALDALGIDIDVSEREAIKLRRRMLEDPESLTDEEHDSLVALYDGELRYTDSQIARLLDAAESAAPDSLAVVVTSDHGEEFGEHGGYSHNPTMYDEILHVPVVVGLPSQSKSAASGYQPEDVELLDIAPTICELVGTSPPDSYRGCSALRADERGSELRVISETTQGDDYKLSVRTVDWKYIWDRNADTTALYHLNKDPGETTSVAEAHPDVATELHRTLEAHLDEIRSTNEELPVTEMDASTEERLRKLGYLD